MSIFPVKILYVSTTLRKFDNAFSRRIGLIQENFTKFPSPVSRKSLPALGAQNRNSCNPAFRRGRNLIHQGEMVPESWDAATESFRKD